MTYTNLLVQTITVFNRTDGATDRYGNATDTWGAGTSVAGRVQASAAGEFVNSQELLNDRDTRISEFLLFLPAGTVISALSEVEVDGDRFRVTGDPAYVFDASATHHIECHITRIQGG